MKIHIEQATPDKASHIASLIMEAMNTECCQNFAGPRHTLADFHQLMERLVWNIADCMNALMAIPNLVSLLCLSGIIVHETRKYLWRE